MFNLDSVRGLIQKYPIISVIAAAAAQYYGGPKGYATLQNVAHALGLL